MELDICGQIIAVSKASADTVCGNNMQFCLLYHEDEHDKGRQAYDMLKEGATMICDIDEPSWSPCMFALIDRYGIHWCIFV